MKTRIQAGGRRPRGGAGGEEGTTRIGQVERRGTMTVFDVFSPPRTSDMAESMGVGTGWAVGKLIPRKDWERWDLTTPKHQDEVYTVRKDMEPGLVMLSPPCTVYSQMHTTNERTRDPCKWSACR